MFTIFKMEHQRCVGISGGVKQALCIPYTHDSLFGLHFVAVIITLENTVTVCD